MDRIIALSRIIKEEAPRFLFFYSHPADIEGAIVFGAINGDVNRYLIDLTDHAYWIGKKSCDKFIEFRELGANIAVKERGVKAEKIRLLPFYPEDRNNIAFEGMPFSEDKDFFFSGGSSYKINGSDEYEKIVCSILSKYTKLNFVYAHEKNIDKNNKLFDIKNKFPGRVYLISERRDLDQILKRAKFYLSTYPIGGGLMCMYAIKNECYPLTLCNDIFITNPKSFLLNPDKIDFCFDNRKNLLDKVDELMCQEKKIYDYSDLIITKSSFNRQLNDILNEHKVSIGFRDIDIFDDCTKLRKLYMDSFDDSKYRELIVNSRNKWVMELLKNRI